MKTFKWVLALFLSGLSQILWAASQEGALSLGSVAGNMLEPVGFMSDFIDSGCIILGGSFLFASIIKYVDHKRSPLMVPISTVVFLVVAGIILVSLPFLSMLTGYGVPFSLLK